MNQPSKIEAHYQEVDLDAVLRYYVKDFDAPPGMFWSDVRGETFVDIGKRKVVFKLYLEHKAEQ